MINKTYTTYLAGSIEALTSSEMTSWRDEVTEKIKSTSLLIYDPVKMEADKVGKPSGQQCEYIKNLKQAGHWNIFGDEMRKIWFSSITPDAHIYELFMELRSRALIDGNTSSEMVNWGDYEAVCRSTFIIVYWPKDTKTVGTIYEVMLAFLLHIPIYLILPDMPKTKCNSSLIYGVMLSGGEIFYSINEMTKFVKEKYNLNK